MGSTGGTTDPRWVELRWDPSAVLPSGRRNVKHLLNDATNLTRPYPSKHPLMGSWERYLADVKPISAVQVSKMANEL